LALENKKLTVVLYSLEGVGLIFTIIFLAAYLGGIPTTNVLHNQPAFRIPLAVFGGVLLGLAFSAAALAVWFSKRLRTKA